MNFLTDNKKITIYLLFSVKSVQYNIVSDKSLSEESNQLL